jgi:hypothetical protein
VKVGAFGMAVLAKKRDARNTEARNTAALIWDEGVGRVSRMSRLQDVSTSAGGLCLWLKSNLE